MRHWQINDSRNVQITTNIKVNIYIHNYTNIYMYFNYVRIIYMNILNRYAYLQ